MSDTSPLRIALIIGSVREGRFGPTVARWFAGQAAQRDDLAVDVVDLADIPLPMELPRLEGGPQPTASRALERLTPHLAAADAFVVVTPEYNHSFPASLKNAIDWHEVEWQAKPVGFVSYGGISGGLRAVEQLRLVFAELHAVTVRDTVSFHVAWERFGPDGRPRCPDGCAAAAKTMLDQLVWWARALHDARAVHSYTS
jgi:NAD(P)H-dependent FMN reductase